MGERGLLRHTAVLTAALLLAFTLRPVVTVTSSLLPDVLREVPLSSAEAGLLGSLPPFCFAAAGLLAPWLFRRFPAERVAAGLLLVAGASQVVRPWAPGAWAFLAVSVLVLVATGVGNVVLPPIVKAWFPERIPTVTALYLLSLTIGTTLPPLVAVPVAGAVDAVGGQVGGWRVSLALWGAVSALAALAWLGPAARPRVAPTARPRTAPAADRPAHPRLWRSRVAWGLTLLFGFQAFGAYVVFAWLPTRLVDAGLSEQRAALMLAVFAVLGLPASLTVPGLVARVHSPATLIVTLAACFTAGLLGLAFVPTPGTLGWVLLTGVGGGLFPLSLTLVQLRTRTPATAGALAGFVQGTGYLIAAVGPFAAAALHDATGRWQAPFVLGAAAVVAAVGGGLLAGRRTVEDDLGRRRAGPERHRRAGPESGPVRPPHPDTLDL